MGTVKSGIQKIRDGDIEGYTEESAGPQTSGIVKSGIQKILAGEVAMRVSLSGEGWGEPEAIVDGEELEEEEPEPKDAED